MTPSGAPADAAVRARAACLRRFARLLPALLLSPWLVGCPSALPRTVTDGGIHVSRLSLKKDMLHAESGRISELRWNGSEVLVVGSEAFSFLDAAGTTVRRVALRPEASRNPVAAGGDAHPGGPIFAAHAFKEDELVLYGADGLRYASAALDLRYAQRLLVTDLTGDAAPEIVIAAAGTKHLGVYDSQAHLLSRPRSPFYIADLDACRGAGARAELVAFVYPNEEGTGTFYWLDGEGKALREWEYDVVDGFDAVCEGDQPVLVTQKDGVYRVLGADGREIARLAAPLGDHFADLQAAPWRGGWVILATGSGYHPHHMLSIFDANGELAYQETGKGWARALAVSQPEGTEFLIAVESEVWRYALAN